MAKMRKPRSPNGSKYDPTRSVRLSDEVWDAMKRRAAYEGVTASYVLAQLAKGYASGRLNLPRVETVYAPESEVVG